MAKWIGFKDHIFALQLIDLDLDLDQDVEKDSDAEPSQDQELDQYLDQESYQESYQICTSLKLCVLRIIYLTSN